MPSKYFVPHGNGVVTNITPDSAGWGYSGLTVIDLAAGESTEFVAEGIEFIVLPLSGSCTVEVAGEVFELAGRVNVWAAMTDWVYVGLGNTARVTSAAGGRFAFPNARATRTLPTRYVPAADVAVEMRGAGKIGRAHV